MLIRLAASQSTLFLITICVVIGAAGVVTNQIEFLTANLNLDFIPSEIQMESEIVILVAAFGVFLEHRYWILDKRYPDGVPEDVNRFDQYSHEFGVFLILVAIFMEAADLLFLALNNWGIDFAGLKYVEISTLFITNILVIVTVAHYGFRVLKETVR